MEQNYITTELAKYNLSDAKIAEMKAEYSLLTVRDLDDMDGYLTCKEAHQTIKKIRTAIEAKRKELKASSLDFGRLVDAEAKRLTGGVLEIENHLQEQRGVIENEQKRIQEEKDRQAREEQARLAREEEERIKTLQREQEEKAQQLKEEEERLEEEKRRNEEEKKRLEFEAERQAREKRQAEEAAERAEQERLDREHAKKKHAEDLAAAEKAAAEKAVKEARERVEAKKAADERKARLAPDKEKVLGFARKLEELEMPGTKTPEARLIIQNAVEQVGQVVDYLKHKADTL